MKTQIWAHRGSSHKYIENSIAAFKQAIEEGADGVELDVQRTLDGQLVVIHDEKLKRLTGVNNFLWELTWEEVQALSLKAQVPETDYPTVANVKIPLLEDVLKLFIGTSMMINIELKNSIHLYPSMEEEVIALVNKLNMQEQVIYSSFNHDSVHSLSELSQAQYCGLLTPDIQYQPWEYLKAVGASAYHCMINSLQQKDLVKNCHDNNIRVHVWTADKEEYINAALLLGVDAIITNLPDLALKLRQEFIDDNGKAARESVKSLGIKI